MCVWFCYFWTLFRLWCGIIASYSNRESEENPIAQIRTQLRHNMNGKKVAALCGKTGCFRIRWSCGLEATNLGTNIVCVKLAWIYCKAQYTYLYTHTNTEHNFAVSRSREQQVNWQCYAGDVRLAHVYTKYLNVYTCVLWRCQWPQVEQRTKRGRDQFKDLFWLCALNRVCYRINILLVAFCACGGKRWGESCFVIFNNPFWFQNNK